MADVEVHLELPFLHLKISLQITMPAWFTPEKAALPPHRR
jgi:hypothetical protein